ncbi:CD209 antigen-like protein D isoform X2 [Denticeps clupeoides]|uniref:C-type lectin domain-containing protein n=2 Tax=Denticeps clupeoides TaxID=299321 RepID=A0AAY4AAF3_9TELE|nr:CD209 antigen-like protein D isoform X2 [Denticeps clupeoides]XP_028835807.1 CD209 antigen-like protein D isoform X2 [Denticeps clupeoides]XP_028835808.1 CD209 antigen-like protein D isoform X2 [Denticeps clupeoides]XP_028835809.1 CD209 antigen-like protein D isoform X2 [Denticeps clupeoides]XP_028835810.1 CD209 antigen-like protein D isoform X2 [Denticeps clupeoides]XP_028835811.1 CD209 antigen-like protein D isoform X2 [Denticeps clupeoides]
MEMEEIGAKVAAEEKESKGNKPLETQDTYTIVEEKEEHESEEVYSKLQRPSEDVYGMTTKGQLNRGHRHRLVIAFLSLLCLSLLVVVIALVVKLQNRPVCQHFEPNDVCNQEKCQALYPERSGAEKCSRCGKDWLDYKGSCYLFSTLRHTWNDSRADCQRKDGDLAVIDSVDVQKFLTKGGYMMYWIGLKRSSGSAHWSWVTGETLKGSYWAGPTTAGDCAFLDGDLPLSNWGTSKCSSATFYICQKKN